VFQSQQTGMSFREILVNDVRVSKYLSKSEIEVALDPKSYLGMSTILSDGAVQKTLAERQSRGL
jgi:adenylosuccinate lyase